MAHRAREFGHDPISGRDRQTTPHPGMPDDSLDIPGWDLVVSQKIRFVVDPSRDEGIFVGFQKPLGVPDAIVDEHDFGVDDHEHIPYAVLDRPVVGDAGVPPYLALRFPASREPEPWSPFWMLLAEHIHMTQERIPIMTIIIDDEHFVRENRF